MQYTLRSMREKRADGDRGFTLIELLVVVVIIGVLVAIATPMYLNYRKGAANKSAASDVRGGISAVEEFYNSNANVYPPDNLAALEGVSLDLTNGKNIAVSASNTARYDNKDNGTYVICAQNSDGQDIYVYSSAVGGSVKKSVRADLAACITNGD